MREIIQNIIFPQNDMLESHYKLYSINEQI